MKYLESGGFKRHPLMRRTLGWTLVLLAGLWVTDFFMYFSRMDLSQASVVSYYLGSEAEFRPPRSYASMLEVAHMHLPMMALVLLLLTHLALFAPYGDRTKVLFVTAAFGTALLNEASGWLVRFVHSGFAWLKVLSFMAFQGILGLLITGLALWLQSAHREARLRR